MSYVAIARACFATGRIVSDSFADTIDFCDLLSADPVCPCTLVFLCLFVVLFFLIFLSQLQLIILRLNVPIIRWPYHSPLCALFICHFAPILCALVVLLYFSPLFTPLCDSHRSHLHSSYHTRRYTAGSPVHTRILEHGSHIHSDIHVGISYSSSIRTRILEHIECVSAPQGNIFRSVTGGKNFK